MRKMENYKRALSEVNTILAFIPKELEQKIPDKFKKIIEQERDKKYKPEINDLILQKNMLQETVVILGLIYRDFLCSYDERKKLQMQDKIELQKLLKDQNETKFDYGSLFKEHMQKQEGKLITIDKKWYEKVIDYFRRIVFKYNKN